MIAPFSLQNAPSLMEVIFPVQRLSAEVFKERQAVRGQTLTSLGSYWKGRKPLILNKACVLGTLLPATGDDVGDLRLFERLMGMDPQALQARLRAALPRSRAPLAAEMAEKRPFETGALCSAGRGTYGLTAVRSDGPNGNWPIGADGTAVRRLSNRPYAN